MKLVKRFGRREEAREQEEEKKDIGMLYFCLNSHGQRIVKRSTNLLGGKCVQQKSIMQRCNACSRSWGSLGSWYVGARVWQLFSQDL